MEKRLFEILDKMNVDDGENKTGNVAISNAVVEAKTAKGGGHITMGVPAEYIHKMLLGEPPMVLLLVIDKKAYDKAKAELNPHR